MSNEKHYPLHPNATHPPVMTCEIPLEEYESLKRENAELKAKLESSENLEASMYADVVDAGMENRRLKRALWLMTAEWAEAMGLASCNIANKFMSRENFEVSDEYRNKTVKKYRHRQVVFYKYADYSRQKAKELE